VKAVLGLGNPGTFYSETRHNLGFRVLERIAGRFRKRFRKEEGRYQWVEIPGEIFLFKPLTYVNRSGFAVREIVHQHQIQLEDLLVVCDDCDLKFGRIRLRKGGSAGGHHGLESIIEQLKTESFPRVRIGIGRPQGESLEEYVLKEFNSEEKREIEEVLTRAADAVLLFMEKGVEKAMSFINHPNY